MDDPIDHLRVDTSLMPILSARVGARAAANLLDDLAHGVAAADLRMMAVLGMMTNHGSVRFSDRGSGSDELGGDLPPIECPQVLTYRTCLGPGVSWDGVHVIVAGSFPETLTLALAGKPVGALIEHPQLDPGLVIDHAFEEPAETYFGTTVRTRPPITIREAIGDQANRMTVGARRIRTLRRRLMVGRHWRSRLHGVLTTTLIAYMALLAACVMLLPGIASFAMITALVVVATSSPFVLYGYLGSDAQERNLGAYYDRMAFATKVRIENGHDTAKHFAEMARTLTG